MAGIGFAPVGNTTPFGFGTPTTAAPPPDTAPLGVAFVDPATKDYTLDNSGEYQRMPPTRQRVALALGMQKRSSSVLQDDGLDLPNKMDASYERVVRSRIRSALAFMTSTGELRIDSITVDVKSPGRDAITVAYTDLTTGQADALNP